MNSTAHRIAIIDVGSNSAKAIVMQYTPGHSYQQVDEIREVLRLREGMTEAGLSETAMTRAVYTLRLFKRFCQSLRADTVIATATSAVREAANQAEFLARVEREAGLHLQVLSGEEEARLGVLGALNAVPLQDGVVLDIGGGSAQVSRVRNRRFETGQALTLGALALTGRFVRSDPIKKSELKKVQDEIERQLAGVLWLAQERGPLVGLGGTIRNLAKVAAARTGFPLNSINGFQLSASSLDAIIQMLREMKLAERRKIAGLHSDRADIILPGALVLRAVMQRLKVNEVTVSERGLREGVFFEHFWRELPYPVTPDLRTFSVLNLARIYDYQEHHAHHVGTIATRLFEQLAALHGYGKLERELLGAAALLHDIGTVVNYNDHHKYSETLITGNGLPGFTPREVALIALIARYHRKGTPLLTEYSGVLQPGDEQIVTRLAAMLRLAEFTERSRSGLVHDIRVECDAKQLHLTLIADDFPPVELWDAQRSATKLLEAAFGRMVTLTTTAVVPAI